MIKKPTLKDELTDQSASDNSDLLSVDDFPNSDNGIDRKRKTRKTERLAVLNRSQSRLEIWDDNAKIKLEKNYFSILITKIKNVLEEGVLHLKSTIGLNYDLSMLQSQVAADPETNLLYDKIKEKMRKIKQQTFNWKVDYRSLPYLKQIFSLVDVFYDPHHFLFIDYKKMQKFLPSDCFIAFMMEPYHSYDENDQIFFDVTEFHSIIVATFKKLYISFPMSTQPRIHPGELNLIDPFMRQHYRTWNQSVFQLCSGLPNQFSLKEFLTRIMEKFVFSGLPRWEQKSGKPLLVPLLGLICECFDYGLIDPCQCDLLLSQLYMISELLSSLEQQIKQKYPNYSPCVEKYYQEFMQCRIEISKIVIHIICVYCDFDYLDSVKQLQKNPRALSILRYFLQDKKAAYSNISLIVLKYLAPKLEIATIKEFSQTLENNISLIFNFIGDYQNDFFTQSLSLIRSEYIVHYLNKDVEVCSRTTSIVLSLTDYIDFIRTAGTANIKQIETNFLAIIGNIKDVFAKNSKSYGYRLEFSKNNVPALLLQIIDYLDRTGMNSCNMIYEGIISLGLILKGNYPGQSVLFTGHTFNNYQSIFLRRYLVTMNMLQYVFHNDYKMFNLANRVFMIKIRIYKQLIKAFREEYQKDQNGDKFIDILGSLYFFNLFYNNILDSNLLKIKNKKRYDLVIAAEIIGVINDFVFPALFDENYLPDYTKVSFVNDTDFTDLRNFENVRSYFRGKDIKVALYEIYYSFLKLFNKSTFYVYSGEVFEKVKDLADQTSFTKLPKNFPGEIYLRAEMLKLFDRFHVFFTNHLLTKRGLYNKNSAVIIGEVFIPVNTWKHFTVFIEEFKWFQDFVKIKENTTPQHNLIIGSYLLKGLLAMLYKYLKGILVFLTIMETTENIQLLKNHTDQVIEEFMKNKGKYFKYVQNMLSKTTEFISEFHESSDNDCKNEDPMAKVASKLAGLFINMGDSTTPKLTKSQSSGNNETNFESDVLEERINPNLKHIREKIMEAIDILDKIYDITGTCRYVVDRYTRNTELVTFNEYMMKNLHSFHTLQNKNSISTGILGTNKKKKTQGILQQIKLKYREKKAYYNQYPTENRFVEYLTQDINSTQYNRSIAEFFVDQMVNMESCLCVAEYERSFYINDIYMQYIITMNNLLSWTDMIRVELHNILYVSKCKKENIKPALNDSKPSDEEFYKYVSPDAISLFLKAIWGTYLNLLMFVYFKTFMDIEWDEYWGKFFLVSTFIQNLCENNYVKFKELLNAPNFGMIEMMRGQDQPGARSVFFENYILLEVLTMNSNVWLNDDKKIVPSDRPEMFQMIRRVMENVTEMLNGPCQKNQLKIFIFRIDMWTGIINRIIDDIDSKFYEVKLACMHYISALLEGLNDQIVQFMGSNLEVHKLFELIIVLTKKLYLKRMITDKSLKSAPLNSSSFSRKKEYTPLNKIAAGIAIIARNSQNLLEEIRNPQQLFDMYNKDGEFSEHIIMNIVITTFVMIKNMSTKIKFYELYLKDKERVSHNYHFEVKSREEAVIYNFISKIIVDIEIVYKSNEKTSLQKFYFKMPPRCFFLTKEMMNRYMEETTVESTTAKRNFLYNNVDALSIEMHENQKNFSRFSSFSYAMTNDAFRNYQMFLVLASVVLNIIMLIYLENLNGEGLSAFNLIGSSLITGIGTLIATISMTCAIVWLFIMYRMEIKVMIAKHQALSADPLTRRELLNIFFIKGLVLHPRFNYFLLQFIFTMLGLFVNNVFFTLNLLLLTNLSKPINYIMRSIINHYDKLLVTLLLTILVIFSYSFILLTNFTDTVRSSDFGDNVCDNFVSCFINSVNLGLRLGGGIGDSLSLIANTQNKNAFWGRFFFDLSFFIIVRLILLNVIAGIIIDTFSDLRDELTTKTHDIYNICYICGTDRWKLEQKGVDFDEHIEDDHNKWKYLFFIVKLSLSDQQAFTGIEFFVWEKYEKNDSSWMPTEIYLKKGENSAPFMTKEKTT